MYSDDTGLSQSADALRMAQFIDACQAAVDAWDDEMYLGTVILPTCTTPGSVQYWARKHGAAHARARIAMHTADGLL